MHNLSTVLNFEIKRTLKKRTFWIAAISFPVVIGLIGVIIYFSNKAANDAAAEAREEKISLEVIDKSGLVKPEIVQAFGGTISDNANTSIKKAQQGEIDAAIIYPEEINQGNIEITAKDVGLFKNERYNSIASTILTQSVSQSVNESQLAAINSNFKTSLTTYKDGEINDPIKKMIAPAIFLILFYLMMAVFGNQMLNTTIEEKENRVIEMLLTTVTAKTVIIGKILALIVLALVQCLVIIIPILIAFLIAKERAPELTKMITDLLSEIEIDWTRMAFGAIIFALGFLLYTGALVAIGGIFPTAKEASSYFGVVMIALFGPLYVFSMIVSSPELGIVQFLTMFPLTAPITLLLRNSVDNISTPEMLASLSILALTSAFVLWLAVRIFQYGSMEYSKVLSFSSIFSKRK